MIYQMLPPVFAELGDQPKSPVIIIISSLKSLIRDQIIEANKLYSSLGIKACSLGDGLDVESIKSGSFNLIFGIPESWLSTSSKNLLSSKFFRRNVVCVVVDEAHKVAWFVSYCFFNHKINFFTH